MKRLIIIVSCTSLIFNFCSSGVIENDKVPLESISFAVKDSGLVNGKCVETCKNFVLWYKDNFDTLTRIQLVDLIETANSAQYRVNYTNVNKYLGILNTSGYLTKDYLEERTSYFENCDETLVETKQSDGPPSGFQSDLILFTQDPEEILQNLESLKFDKIMSNDSKTILIQMNAIDHNVIFELKEVAGKCLIDDIKWGKL